MSFDQKTKPPIHQFTTLKALLFHFKGLKDILQHFKFVNWRIRGFGFWCHEQVICFIIIFVNFFPLKNMNLRVHFLLSTFFDNITLFSKMMPNFWRTGAPHILKIQRFPLSILFFGYKSSFSGPIFFKIPQPNWYFDQFATPQFDEKSFDEFRSISCWHVWTCFVRCQP